MERIETVQRPQGYRLVAAFADEADEQAAAAAGFRVATYLAWGRVLYCDDLSTIPTARGRGLAGSLLDWMLDEADRLECDQFHLDSGTQAARTDAHRLYFNRRMRVSAFHFQRDVR